MALMNMMASVSLNAFPVLARIVFPGFVVSYPDMKHLYNYLIVA